MSNIVIFSHEFPPSLGGAGTIAEILYKFFSDSQDYAVSVITSSKSASYQQGDLYTSFLPPMLWPISYYIEYKRELESADVVICNDPAAIYNAGRYFSNELLSKTICFIHGEEKYLGDPDLLTKAIRFSKNFLRAIYNSYKVIFVSKYIQEFYLEQHKVDMELVNASIVNPGVYSAGNDICGVVKPRGANFITVCRLNERKGFAHMLNVFEQLTKLGLQFKWDIVGDGQYMDELKQMINQSSISNYINILGPVNRSQLPEIYKANDYCILLSELNESYGLSYLEAAHFGVKPIGYSRCGVKDVFNHIENGLLLDNYKNIKLNANDIYSFVSSTSMLSASSFRGTKEFARDIENIVLKLFKDKV